MNRVRYFLDNRIVGKTKGKNADASSAFVCEKREQFIHKPKRNSCLKIAYLSFLALGFVIISSSSASAVNRFAVANGNWNATTTWAATSGGAAGVSAPVAGDDVFIGEAATNRTVTIPTGVSAACTSLTMGTNTDNTVATLNFATNTSTLTVSGNLTMIRPNANSTSTIGLGAGSLTVNGTLTLANHADSSTAGNRVNTLTISTGTLTVGNLVFEAQDAAGLQSQVVFSGAGTMNLKGNLTFTNNLGVITPSTSTVDLNGTGSQTIDGSGQATFNNLTVSNTGGIVTLSDNQTVGAALTVKAGATLALDTFNLGTPTSLTMEIGSTGASITGSTGTLTLGGNVTVNATSGSSGASISSPVALGATRTFTIANDGTSATDLTVSGVVSGGGFGVTKAGAGTMVLSTANTYTGAVTINAGILSVATINNGGTAGNLGQATSAAANLVLGGGTLQYTGATASTNRAFTLTAATTSSIDVTTNNLTISGVSAATTGSLTKVGAGTLTLSGANTYTGITTINAGVLSVATINNGGTAGNLGQATSAAANLVLGGGTLQYTGATASTNRAFTLTAATTSSIEVTTGGTSLTVSGGTASTTGALTKIGGGTLILSAVSGHTGLTTVSNGTLSLGGAASTNTIAGDITINGGTLNYSAANNDQIANTSNMSLSSGVYALGTITETIGSLNMTGGSLTRGGAVLTLSNASSITGGTLTFSSAASSRLTTNSTLALGGATFDYTSASTGTNNMILGGDVTYAASNTAPARFINSGGGSAELQIGSSGTRTFNVTQASPVLGQAEVQIAWRLTQGGTTALTKSGTGTLQLSGTNTFTGGTTLSAGTLNVNNAQALGNLGTFTISGGTIDSTTAGITTVNYPQAWNGDFTFTGTNSLNLGTGTVTLNADRQVTVSANTLTVGGIILQSTRSLTKLGAGTLSFGSNAVTLNSLTISTGTLTSTSATMNLAGGFTNNGTFTHNSGIVNFNGSAAQTIGGGVTSFNSLTVTNPAGVTLGVNTIVGGVLDLAGGDITTGVNPTYAFTLFQGGTSSASGAFDVVGNVHRGDVNSSTPVSFGNVNVQITQGTSTGVDWTVTLYKSAPTDFTNAVSRTYDIIKNGGSVNPVGTTVRLRYKDASPDETNGNAELMLQLWKKDPQISSTYLALPSTRDASANWVQAANVTNNVETSPGTPAPSRWVMFSGSAPTACKLEGFQAARSDDGVVLEWRTGYEVNNVGFNVYRQGSDGEMVKLTKHMVAGSGLMVRKNTVLTSGLSYYWSDPDTKKGDHPQYWLEDLDADGHTSWNGPFIINEALVPTRPIPGGKAAPGEKGGRGDANSMTINSISEENEQSGAYQPSGPVESTAKAGKMKLAAAVQQADLAGKLAVKISINREGWYRITQAQLVAAGISTSTDGKKLQLFADSQEIPIIVGGNGRGFDPSAYVEFYGQGLDTPSTDTRVYWLVVGANGLRIKTFTGLSGGSAGDSFPYTVQRKDRLFYRSEIQNGDAENFFGAFIYYQPTDQALTVNRIAPAANTTLEIALQGFNAGPHQVQVSLNGAIVGTLNFNDRVRQVFTLTAPQALLTEGANKVTLQALAGNSDFSFVDYIKLTYAHKFEAENNSLKLTAPGSSSVTLNGFTGGNIRVVDVTDPKAVQELLPKPSQGNSTPATSITVVTFGGGTRTLLAFVDTKQAAKVAANKPSSLRQSSNQADLVIIGAGDFSSSLQSLQSLRQGQGIQTMLLDVEDVYDEFSFGQKSPNAVKDFLSYARTNWKKAPKYVLLGGMASFDPRNYMGLGNTDFVPTKIVMTEHLETASDDWFVDFNNDGMPEMALGRLPARNADEAARMVQKLVNYDQAASGAGVLLVADVNKGFDFEHNNDLLKAIVPGTTAVQDLRRASDPQAKQTLLTALNQGKKLVNYTGHGSVDIWEASLLTSTDAAGLANAQKLSLVVAMTCLNGYFFDERFESLAHALVNAQNGGAVAVWSSTGLTEPDPQSLADQELFRQLFAGASVRLGDAALKAKAAITDSDVRRTWVLIGDPTMRFKQ